MSEPDLPPLEGDLAALLAIERTRADAPDEAKARVRARLELAVLGLAAAGAGAAGGASATAAAHAGLRSLILRYRTLVAGAFLVGGASGAALVALHPLARTPVATVAIDAGPAVAPSALAPAAPPASVPAPTSPVEPAPSPTTGAVTPSPSSSSSTMAAEQRLLDGARAALLRGEPASAMKPIETHAARYPNGALAEEREALAVEALVGLHRYDEARARAAAFRRRFPGSLNTGAVDAALKSVP